MFNVNEAVDELIDDINVDYYESCYDAIYEELCDRVAYGELTIEEAEMINDAAAEKYLTEGNAFNKIVNNTVDEGKKLENRIKAYDKLQDDTPCDYTRSGYNQYVRLNDKNERKKEELEKLKEKRLHGSSYSVDPFEYKKMQDKMKSVPKNNPFREDYIRRLRKLKQDWMIAHGDIGKIPEKKYKSGRYLRAQQQINSKK